MLEFPLPATELTVVEGNHPGDALPAHRALLGLGQRLVALAAGANVPALEEDAGFGGAQADDAGVFERLAAFGTGFVQQALLGLPELVLHPPEVPLLAVMPVLLPQDDKEDGTGGETANEGEDFPEAGAGFLFLQQGGEIGSAQVVGHALLRGLQLDGGVVQDQLAHPCQRRAHLQHLLRLLDALRALATDVVTDDVGEGLHGGVEFLIHRLQAELGGFQWLHHPDSHAGAGLLRDQVKGGGVGSLVDDLLIVVPGEGEEGTKQRQVLQPPLLG